MFPFDADCSYCRYLRPSDEKKGKFYCEKKREYVSARASICSMAAEVMGRPNCDKEALRRISRSHGYYVVTAITEILDLDSDNIYMSSFRYLRDVILPNMIDYQDFIAEYDSIGPAIAERLKSDPESQTYAEYLRVCFLDQFVAQFESNSIDTSIATYSQMFEQLKDRYGISKENIEQKKLVCKDV